MLLTVTIALIVAGPLTMTAENSTSSSLYSVSSYDMWEDMLGFKWQGFAVMFGISRITLQKYNNSQVQLL